MNSILAWLTPPFVGAFIGYMTNYVAIRMLFRPLKPWRILGIRLPMTPGVIPSKRHELAENIGEMVGEHLLTSADISRAINEQGFQRDLKKLIEGRIGEILAKDLGPVVEIIPKRFRSYFEVGVKILRWRFLKHLRHHLESVAFEERTAAAITIYLNNFLAQELSTCLPEKSRRHFFETLEAMLTRFLAGPDVEQWLTAYINQEIDAFIKKGGRPKDLLTEAMGEALLNRLAAEAAPLLVKLAAMIEEPAMQEKIATGLTNAIRNFTASLGPMAAMIGNFISPETIGNKIKNYLAEKGSDISASLLDSSVQEKVAAILRRKAEEFLATPVADLTREIEPEKIQDAGRRIGATVAGLTKRPETIKALTTLLEEALAVQSDRPLSDILTDLFGEDGIHKGRERATAEIIGTIRSQKAKRMLDDLVTELVEKKLLTQPVGPLSDFLPQEVQHGLGDYLLQQISVLLAREVPGLVDSLDIRRTVTRKVDSLDLLRLEGLLLGIMQEQFKYINLFGALLGFLIGLINLLFLPM